MSSRLHPALGAASGGGLPGQIDYRLARNAAVRELRRGRRSKGEVCDAHPELLRAARSLGREVPEACPICELSSLVHVSYAFGRRLSPGGHAFDSSADLARLTRRAGEVACYVVEVCTECSWNHLVRTFSAGCSPSAT